MDKLKVCAYARVSTNKDDQLNSFENQLKYFKDLAEEKNEEWEFTGMYADKGITGTSLNKRTEFNKMLTDAGLDIKEVRYNKNDRRIKNVQYNYWVSDRVPKFNLILIKNTSRFARNVMSIQIIRELREKGVYIHFTEINKSTKDLADEFLIQLFQLLDEQESKEKSRRVRFGHEQGAKKGIIHVSRIYGYKLIKGIKSSDNQLKIILSEAEVIKKIFELYEDGFGIRKIIKYLTEHKIKTREGKEFSKSAISNILQNEKYAGILVRNKYDRGIVFNKKGYAQVRDKSEWFIHEGVIPPIITKESFDKCQKIRENKTSTKNQKGIYHGASEYAGLLKCDKCGSNYTRNSDRGRIFYNCSLKRRKGVSTCDNINVSLKIIEEELDKLVKEGYKTQINIYKEFIKYALENVKEDLKSRIDKDVSNIVCEKQNKVIKLKEGMNRLLDLYTDLSIDKDDYIYRSNNIKEEIESLEKEINELNKSNFEIEKDIDSINETIQKLEDIKLKDIYSKEEIINSIKYIKVSEKEGKPYLFFMYDFLDTYARILSKYYKEQTIYNMLEEGKNKA